MPDTAGRVLVTGGCGFIGSNLVPRLINRGYEVRVYDNLHRGSVEYLNDVDCEIWTADIRDRSSLLNALSGVDAVVHLAAYGSVVESVEDPSENFSVNVVGTFTVLDACRRSGIRRLVFSSTGGALIGDASPPVSETSLPRPISPYGSSKLAGEAYCCSFAKSYGMDIVSTRFANVIGPISAHKRGAVTSFINAIKQGVPIEIFGDGSATRDFLYVDDLCVGIESALVADVCGFVPVHLASGREVSVLDLANLICDVANVSNHPIEFRESRVGEVSRNFADYGLARELFGFYPATTLRVAVEKTWKWFENCSSQP